MLGLLYFAVLSVLSVNPTNALIDCANNPCVQTGTQHPLCRYPDPRPSPACRTIHEVGITQDEIREIVTKHNEYRSYVAQGFEARGNPGPQPPAKNMGLLLWDYQLAETAQRWVNQCSLSKASCVDDDRFKVNQIRGVKTFNTKDEIHNATATDFIRMFYNSVDKMDRDGVAELKNLDAIGYTQIVWGKTEKIGCGKIAYDAKDKINYHFICLYAPAGNIIGEPVYEVLLFQ